MEIIKNQTLHSDDLRRLCITENFYTQGSNEQYINLLQSCNGLQNPTNEQLYEIAQNIAKHSNHVEWCAASGMEYINFVEEIMFLLYKILVTTFVLEV